MGASVRKNVVVTKQKQRFTVEGPVDWVDGRISWNGNYNRILIHQHS